jgi:RNase P/RNase MRP subunit p30
MQALQLIKIFKLTITTNFMNCFEIREPQPTIEFGHDTKGFFWRDSE